MSDEPCPWVRGLLCDEDCTEASRCRSIRDPQRNATEARAEQLRRSEAMDESRFYR